MMQRAAVKQAKGMQLQAHQTSKWKMTLYRTLRVMKVSSAHSTITEHQTQRIGQYAAYYIA
jgi:hypothetical protein